MSRTKKILLGIATFWPFGYMFLFFAFILLMIAAAPGGGGEFGGLAGIGFVFVMLLHFLTIFLILGLQIYYIIHAVKNELLTQNSKIMWIVAFFFGSFFAMPIYWYITIWKAVDEDERQFGSLQSGAEFNPAYGTEQETRTGQQVPREPHSWR